MKSTRSHRLKTALFAGLVAILLASCGGSEDTPAGERIASTARMAILEPAQGAEITAPRMRVLISLEGARIIPRATTTIKPDEGHVHLSLNGELSTMTYGLDQEIDITPGTHILQAEYVAGDHAPFNPRIIAVRRIEVK